MEDSTGDYEGFPFAPSPSVEIPNNRRLKVFIDKGLVEDPEVRMEFKHAPFYTIEISPDDIQGKRSIDLMKKFFKDKYEKDFGKPITEGENGLIDHLRQELGVSDVNDPRVYTSKFSEAFHRYSSGNVAEDVLIKSYFMLQNPTHFLFRGAQVNNERQWSEMPSNIEAFGTEYHPAQIGSPSEFWAEKGELKTSVELATPTEHKPFSVFMVFDSTNMQTSLKNTQTMKYSWESTGQPLAVKRQFAFLLRLTNSKSSTRES